MKCERCHNEDGEWQCKVCRRVIGSDCVVPTDSGVYCADHVPQTAPVEKTKTSGGSKSLRNAFMTLLFLTIGIVGIGFIGQMFMPDLPPAAGPIKGTIESLQSMATLVIAGLAGLTALVGLAYFATTRKKN